MRDNTRNAPIARLARDNAAEYPLAVVAPSLACRCPPLLRSSCEVFWAEPSLVVETLQYCPWCGDMNRCAPGCTRTRFFMSAHPTTQCIMSTRLSDTACRCCRSLHVFTVSWCVPSQRSFPWDYLFDVSPTGVEKVRFDSSRRRSSRILFLTEGLLLRQIASDPNLSSYSVVIVDEVRRT